MMNQFNDICMICLESTNKYAINICRCKIYIHDDCFLTWINLYNSCIICKSRLYSFDKNLNTRFKYLDRELEESSVLMQLDSIIKFISQLSNKINCSIIKILLFNIFFGCILFLFLIPILVYYGIISQTKYSLDYYKDNKLYGTPYQIFTLKI